MERSGPPAETVTWVRYSTTVVRSGGTAVVFDPVGELPDLAADVVCLSHEHHDHFDARAVKRLALAGAAVVAPPSIAASLESRHGVEVVPVTPGDELQFDGVALHVGRCHHPAEDPVTYLLTLGSGATVYFPHDSDASPEMTWVLDHGALDVILWAGSSIQKCAAMSRVLRPGSILFPTYNGAHYVEHARSRLAPSVTPATRVIAMWPNQPLRLDTLEEE